MTALAFGPSANLEDLRDQLAGHLAILAMAASSLVMVGLLVAEPFPALGFCLLAVCLAWGQAVRRLLGSQPRVARHMLLWGLLAALLGAMRLLPNPWLPFIGSLLAFGSAMLVPGSELAAPAATLAVAVVLARVGVRAYPLPELVVALGLGAALAKVLGNTLYTALHWAWATQQQADRLLEETRDRRAELSRTLKSLELAYELQRRTQDDLIAARLRAEEARRMKEQFAANISHELRTPLNLILGFSEVMDASPEVYGDFVWPGSLREDVHQIHQSSSHLLEMIDDILDLSRFEMAGFTLRKEPTSLEQLLRSAAAIAEDLFRGRPVRLEVEVEPNLPMVEIDRTRIRQVVLNLLNNAQRFTRAGSVRIEAKRAGGEVVISVRDTGSGIPADKLPLIFEQFYQVDQSLSRSQQGAGLGLAICKRFVEAHDGRIWAESAVGVGSTFHFALSIPGQHPLAPQLHYAEAAEARPAPRPCVLLAEPDRAVAGLIRRHAGEYEIVQVDDARRLAGEVAAYRPRAVIRNVDPSKQREPEEAASLPVPVIECSLPSQAWVAEDLGVVGCLTKPVTAQRILEILQPMGAVHDVLIVDDDRGFGQLIRRMLQAGGLELAVRQAYSGAEGLAAMHQARPGLVLLDLMMPEIDGFQLLEVLRGDPELADVPVALLTATSVAEDALRQGNGQMVIRRSGGLRPAETLRCLRAVLGVLEPQNGEPPGTADVGPELA